MKIVEIATVRVQEFPNLTFVEITTDEGFVGLGETFYGAAAVEAHIHSIAAPALLGTDPLSIERNAMRLTGYTGYSGSGAETRARSAVDLALWDILGQASGQPVYNLLGGLTRADIPIYNTCAGARYVNHAKGQSVANWGVAAGQYEDLYAAINHPAELARELLDHGITGMKIWPFDPFAEATDGTRITSRELAEALRPFAAIRDAVGMEMDIMVELHALWDVPGARRILRALEEFEPFWAEDPVRSDIVGGLAAVADTTSIRIAAGETIAGAAGFQQLLAEGAIGVATVDTTWSGGLTTAKKVASAAASYGVPIAPHDCTGPVALAACVHLGVSAPNVLVQETVRAGYLGWYSQIVEGGPIVESGRIRPADRPGLGVALLPGLRRQAGTTVVTSSLEDAAIGSPAVQGRIDHALKVDALTE